MARKPRDLMRFTKEAQRLAAGSPLMKALRGETPEPAKPEVATNKAPEASTANSQQRFDRSLPKQLKDQNPNWPAKEIAKKITDSAGNHPSPSWVRRYWWM